jgi:hypothetical protein
MADFLRRQGRHARPASLEELEGWTLLSTLTVVNTSDSGAGSFRQAILDANNTPGANTISFAIGTGVQTIKPVSALPAITNAVTIDATTQPNYAGKPLIVLDGSLAGANANGLTITAGSSIVRGLVIDNWSGDGIELSTNGNNQIQGNYIGTDATGGVAGAKAGYGIEVASGLNNTIGGTAAGTGNLISGNIQGGIRLTGGTVLVSETNAVLRVDPK